MEEISDLMAAEHQRVLLLRTALRDAERRGDGEGARRVLAEVWDLLATVLDVHADAEEEICHLPMAAALPDGLEETEELAADLWEIREGSASPGSSPPGRRPGGGR